MTAAFTGALLTLAAARLFADAKPVFPAAPR